MKKNITLLSGLFLAMMPCISTSFAQESNGDSFGVVRLILTESQELIRSDNGENWVNVSLPPLKDDADRPETLSTLFRKEGKFIMGSDYAYGPAEGRAGIFTSTDGIKWERRAELEGRLEELRAIDTNQGVEYFAFTSTSHPTNPHQNALKVYRTFDIDSPVWEEAKFDNLSFAEGFADDIAFGRQSDGSFIYYISAHKTRTHPNGGVMAHYGVVYRSANGIDWTEEQGVAFDAPLKSIAYGNGHFLSAGWLSRSAGPEPKYRIYKTSANPNSVNLWQKAVDVGVSLQPDTGGDYGLSVVTNNRFYLVTGGHVHSSEDGVNWDNSFEPTIYGTPVSFSYNETVANDLKDCSLQDIPKGEFLLGTYSSYLLSSADGQNWSPIHNIDKHVKPDSGRLGKVKNAASFYYCIKDVRPTGKKVVATTPSPQDSNLVSYWWSDGGYSEWSEKDKQFIKNSADYGNWFKERGWPAGKQVAAIYPNPSNKNLTIYWWTDGSYSDWNNTEGRFEFHAADQGVWFDHRGWPSGKTLAAISAHPAPQKRLKRIYWWTDGTYSEWDTSWGRFDHHENGSHKPIKNWPEGKRVIAVTNETKESDPVAWWNNGEEIYWWSDGGHSVYSKFNKAFIRHMNDQGDWFTQRGWPEK